MLLNSLRKVKNMKSEIHLFILWQKARKLEQKILEDISCNFLILQMIEIDWRDDFSTKISKFYGENLPPYSDKEKHVGSGKFLLVIVLDKNPLYQIRRTSKGAKRVNVNMFDSKEMYRKWTGGGHRIHASNDIIEAEHDLKILIGKSISELRKIYSQGGQIDYSNKYICNSENLSNLARLCKKSRLIVAIYSIYYNFKGGKNRKKGLEKNRVILTNILSQAGYGEIVPISMKEKWSVDRKAYFIAKKNEKEVFIKFSNETKNHTYDGIKREWNVLKYINEKSYLLKEHVPEVYEMGEEGDWSYIATEYIENAGTINSILDFSICMKEYVRELQKNKIIHMDLGMRNIIIDKRNKFYIIDWEFARVEDLVLEDSLYSMRELPKEIENLGLKGTPQKGYYDDMYALLVMLKDICPDFKKECFNEWRSINMMIGEYHFEFERKS